VLAAALVFGATPLGAQGVAAKAKESGCVDKPKVVEGSTYRCSTSSGAAAYFNVPEGNGASTPRRQTMPAIGAPPNANQPSPGGLPRVDAATQRSRDELRRKVLQEELVAEEKLLAEARTAFASGAPKALPEEQSQPQRYAERVSRLRAVVQQHERNIEMLRKELAQPR
jgi:hypothetical protein